MRVGVQFMIDSIRRRAGSERVCVVAIESCREAGIETVNVFDLREDEGLKDSLLVEMRLTANA